MDIIWVILFIAVVAVSAEKFLHVSDRFTDRKKARKIDKKSDYPYFQKSLLTKHELDFYKRLKKLTDEYGLWIIAKTRLADLVDVKPNDNQIIWNSYFAKIKSKHIDFVIVEPEGMTAECLIELDDRSHDRPERQERDEFVNNLCRETGWRLIRTYGNTDEIQDYLEENWVKI